MAPIAPAQFSKDALAAYYEARLVAQDQLGDQSDPAVILVLLAALSVMRKHINAEPTPEEIRTEIRNSTLG